MNKKVLFIATEYPPAFLSSGVQRILKFSRYLSDFSWDVSVLTMKPMAYGKDVNDAQVKEIPTTVPVKRALAFNASIHFSIKGRYFRFMALPDRWSSWVIFGFFAGLKSIRQHRPDVLFSSYPHASAHMLAFFLHKATGIPWVADFRDPMLYRNNHLDKWQAKVFDWLERKTIESCQYAIFTTPGAIENYAKQKFPKQSENKWHLISNGYDEENFTLAEAHYKALSDIKVIVKPLIFVHAGLLYRAERDPTSFFKALASLLKEGKIKANEINVILRAPGSESYFQDLISEYKLNSVLHIKPRISYQNTLREMFSVDGLLLFQGSLCNHQIPAKVYEYFRAKKPIFAMTDNIGDTAKLLRSANVPNIAPLDDEQLIADRFLMYFDQVKAGTAPVANNDFVAQQSRQARTAQLADILNLCVAE